MTRKGGKKRVKWARELVTVPGVRICDYESETAMQIYCMTWLRKQFLITGDARFEHWHHSANERSNGREGFLAKMMGQSRGFPDLVHLGLRVGIELKVPGGKVSPLQADWLSYLQGIGWTAKVVWSFEEFRDLVEGLGRV
jgi:hypothetical protein